MNIPARAYAKRDSSRFWRKLMKLLDALHWWDDKYCQWQWLEWRDRENRKNGFRGKWKRIG